MSPSEPLVRGSHDDRRHAPGDRGTVMLELALALPVLVFLFMTTTEYIRALQVHQTLAMLSREAANAAFRDCVELDTAKKCLQDLSGSINGEAQKVLPGVEMILSIYAEVTDPISGTTSIQQLGMEPDTGTTASGYQTHYTLAQFQGSDKPFLQLQQRIAIAEFFVRFRPIIQNAPIGTEFYDAAVY